MQPARGRRPVLSHGRALIAAASALGLIILGSTAGAQAAAVAGCGDWARIASPNPNGAARLNDIHVISPWDVWAVGWFDGPIPGSVQNVWQSLTLHWNGSAWSIVPSPNPAPNPTMTQVTLAAVSAVSSVDVWAVGGRRGQDAGGYSGTRVLAMRWDGFTWRDMNAPWPPDRDGSVYTGASGEEFYDVVALPSGEVWAVGRWWHEAPGGVITWPGVAMRWNGSSFDVFELPMVSPAGRQFANSVAAVSRNDIWVVGEGDGAASPAYVWHWNGSSWSSVPAPTPGAGRALNGVIALAANDVWAGGWYRDASYNYFPLILHWNGSIWTQVATPAGGDTFAAWAPDHILTYGTNGWAHWDGTRWTAQPGLSGLGIVSPVVQSMSVESPCELWVAGWQYLSGVQATLTVKLEFAGPPADTDGDGVPDAVDNCPTLFNPNQADCDGDGAGDACELSSGTAQDCNGNLTPDNCETFTDCDANQVPDECEPDCNANGVADACDIAGGASPDCNANGVPDECDQFADCNRNHVSDWCDINAGRSLDTNGNGFPDECEALGPGFATVNTLQDVVDFGGAQRLGDLPGPDGLISFREAVIAANNTPGPQTVAFNIPPADWGPINFGIPMLRLENGLFVVTGDETTLDFATQTAFAGDTNPNGADIGIYGLEANAWGIEAILIVADKCTVKGLGSVMQRGYGVRIAGNGNRVVGSTINGPFYAAVYITGGWQGPVARGNVIGGTGPGERNVLSAGNDGVRIDAPAADNVVIGNVLSGSFSGVSIRGGATGNRIGGLLPAERNVISGSGFFGEEGCPVGEQVSIENSPDNVIEGNYIGLTADGSAGAGQSGTVGVEVRDSSQTLVRNNVIGGILVVGTDHCSGIRYGDAVQVSGSSSGTVMRNNLIGTDAAGVNPVVNVAGVRVVSWPQSGAPAATLVEGNTIAFSEKQGVAVGPDVAGVAIRGNSIFDNGGLGIDLSVTGNGGQPEPSVTSAVTDDVRIRVEGSLSAAPQASYAVDVFVSPACDPSGSGEGRIFLDSVVVATDASGLAPFSLLADVVVPAGAEATATATALAAGNTSEFSACRAVELGACSWPPGEVRNVVMDYDLMTVAWAPFGPSVSYDVARGDMGGRRSNGAATCVATGLTTPFFTDQAVPTAGLGFFYLVRAANACGPGSWQGPGGAAGAACP